MNPTEFIRKNIVTKLLAENFTLSVAQGAAHKGVEFYLKACGASRRGGLFDDCYQHAKAWAIKNTTTLDKPIKQKKTRTVAAGRAISLF
ncbi:hypothetical protein [Pragia fontium]|uniref:hypothetical protein n=1 Tax=Pragia fontium TaxID=82985 RepID=UPI000F6FBA39|nr:hypothetical protein [Pragia fontium]VEJ54596.1 Uncharacterised protein [Pragia fontium]